MTTSFIAALSVIVVAALFIIIWLGGANVWTSMSGRLHRDRRADPDDGA